MSAFDAILEKIEKDKRYDQTMQLFEKIKQLESEKAELLEELERIIKQEKIDCNLNLDKYRG